MQIDMDQEIVRVLEDEDYFKIMIKASRPFKTILTEDELESCKRVATWKALKKFDPSKGASFMTFLYRGVFLECKMAAKFVMKHRLKKLDGTEIKIIPIMDSVGVTRQHEDTDIKKIEFLEEINSVDGGDILIDYFINGMSLQEIGDSRNIKKSRAASLKNKAIKILKKRFA
jgi:RNA polymerase sigma factor (sigma-70 family)